MSIFDKYPYTNFHELNDDWIIKTLREFGQRLDEFVAMNSLTYADPIEYDPETAYAANTVVIYDNAAYVSKQPIPAGMLPTNDAYWLLIFPFGDLIEQGVNVGLQQIDEYLQQAQHEIDTAIETLPGLVDTWMTNHPDVTTTVPNGGVSYPKLNASLKNVILAEYAEDPEVQYITDFVQGDISWFGDDTPANDACRTDFILFPKGIIVMSAASGYNLAICKYKIDGTYEYIEVSISGTTANAFAADPEHKYRLKIRKSDGTDFTPADLPTNPVIYQVFRSVHTNDPLASLETVGTSTAVDGLICRGMLPDDFFTENANPQSYAEAAPYLDGIINNVMDGKHLIFTTDRHCRRDSEDTQLLQQYVRSNLNISRVVFGGDVLNRLSTQYLAYQVMNEYFDLNASAFGAAFLPVFGNHDLNTANSPDPSTERMNIGVAAELFTRHLDGYVHFETSKYYGNVTGNDIVTIMQTIVDNKIAADSTIPATLGMTRDEIVDAMLEYNKLHYYVDDDINKIRYIVYNTGAPDNIVVQKIFGVTSSQTEIYLQIDWLYETLMTTPIGYDIVLSGHLVTLDPKTTANSYINSTFQFDILAQLSCLKKLASMNTSITSDLAASINQDWTPTARRTLDFTNAPAVGKIIVLAGHWHRDYAAKGYFHRAPTGSGGHYAPGDYAGVLINSGSTVDESQGEILIVGTAADKDMTDQQVQLSGVDAVAIDIVTLADDLVEFKRIGHSLSYDAGNDTGAHTDPITRTFTIS